MRSNIAIRAAETGDIPALLAIYNHYVRHTTATFQEDPATASGFCRLLGEAHPFLCALAAEGDILGYCYAAPFKSRCGYRHTQEISIYVARKATRQGAGEALMTALLSELAKTDARSVVAVIGLPNPASVSFHEKFGFVHCGTLPAVGRKFDKWLDSGYWLKDLSATERQ